MAVLFSGTPSDALVAIVRMHDVAMRAADNASTVRERRFQTGQAIGFRESAIQVDIAIRSAGKAPGVPLRTFEEIADEARATIAAQRSAREQTVLARQRNA